MLRHLATAHPPMSNRPHHQLLTSLQRLSLHQPAMTATVTLLHVAEASLPQALAAPNNKSWLKARVLATATSRLDSAVVRSSPV